MSSTVSQKFTVKVDDNFDYQDEDERYTLGEFDSYEEAQAACQQIVDDFLVHTLAEKGAMTADALYQHYVDFGEDPFISPEPHWPERFSAWSYAKERCGALCKQHE